MINIYLDNKFILHVQDGKSISDIKSDLHDSIGLEIDSTYALYNGKLAHNDDFVTHGIIRLVPKILGGKGGFGSMLRAIGAQIEKTTNREACRDLSGRRLRDINEEKRLKTWINNQSEREQEAADRKQQKIQRLCSKPKHEFQDKTYDEERSQMTENVADAVEAGFQSTSKHQVGQKRKSSSTIKDIKKKKSHLWIDVDEDDLSLDSEDSSADENEKNEGKNVGSSKEENDSNSSSNNSNMIEISNKSEVTGNISVSAC